jgi:ferredoxin hydrogenase small subunit
MENLGCMATQVHADCNIRLWNGDGSCTRGGYPCISCTEPGFEHQTHAYLETPKLAGIPIGLPTDMPKAWFVALAALSKAATPTRVKSNAVADYIITAPSAAKGKAPK